MVRCQVGKNSFQPGDIDPTVAVLGQVREPVDAQQRGVTNRASGREPAIRETAFGVDGSHAFGPSLQHQAEHLVEQSFLLTEAPTQFAPLLLGQVCAVEHRVLDQSYPHPLAARATSLGPLQ